MSNDAVVRPLSFDSSPGVPYAVYLERAIAQALPKTLLPRAPARCTSVCIHGARCSQLRRLPCVLCAELLSGLGRCMYARPINDVTGSCQVIAPSSRLHRARACCLRAARRIRAHRAFVLLLLLLLLILLLLLLLLLLLAHDGGDNSK